MLCKYGFAKKNMNFQTKREQFHVQTFEDNTERTFKVMKRISKKYFVVEKIIKAIIYNIFKKIKLMYIIFYLFRKEPLNRICFWIFKHATLCEFPFNLKMFYLSKLTTKDFN